MAFPSRSGGPSFQHPKPFPDAEFDIFQWHIQLQSCVRYFLDHAQHSVPVQALAALVNIQLPFQRKSNPVFTSKISGSLHPHSPLSGGSSFPGPSSLAAGKMPFVPGHYQQQQQQQQAFVTVIPYVRRLVATGSDNPSVLHGFFGDDWAAGVGPIHEVERRNYLFAAKSDNWLKVKNSYDMDDGQIVPFLKPLQNVTEKEIVSAETNWSEWLAMQDWMLGPRAPIDVDAAGGSPQQTPHSGRRIKREEQ